MTLLICRNILKEAFIYCNADMVLHCSIYLVFLTSVVEIFLHLESQLVLFMPKHSNFLISDFFVWSFALFRICGHAVYKIVLSWLCNLSHVFCMWPFYLSWYLSFVTCFTACLLNDLEHTLLAYCECNYICLEKPLCFHGLSLRRQARLSELLSVHKEYL